MLQNPKTFVHLSNDEVHLSLVLDLHGFAIDRNPLLYLQLDGLNLKIIS